jgi:Ca2+-binding RTX toxin-like protein
MYRAALAVVSVVLGSMYAMTGTARPAAPTCLGKPATIVGTAASETIRGTAGDDVIVGGGGALDALYGLGGDDRLCADSESARGVSVWGGPGDDRIRGSGELFGGGGNDRVTSPQRDSSSEALFGGPGDDVLRSRGTEANNMLPGPGDDTVIGGRGAFFNIVNFRTSPRGVVVDLAAGTAVGQGHDALVRMNSVIGSDHADTMFGDDAPVSHFDLLFGRDGNDVLVGRGSHNGLSGGDGDDYLAGGPIGDGLSGGTGRDTLLARGGNDDLHERKPEPNLILAGAGKDNCWGHYKVPPNVERSCETHHQMSGGDKTLPDQWRLAP